ncbi:unnamed protein product [Gongylonema pulchrum]|uniref:MATH domain-containing protein n=1 Tax=Gongylonema pulchrum TaxID=637853 RepID=A0A183DT88_9BILA|nr:unnamed protein product [Gongylonema pulchrum]
MTATEIYGIFLIVCAELATTPTGTSSDKSNVNRILSYNSDDLFNTIHNKSSNIISSSPGKKNNSDDQKNSTPSEFGEIHNVDSDNILENSNNYTKRKFIHTHFGRVRSGNRSNSSDNKNSNNSNDNSNDNKRFIRIHFGRSVEENNADNNVRTFQNNSVKTEFIRDKFEPLFKCNHDDRSYILKHNNDEGNNSDKKRKLIHIHFDDGLDSGSNSKRRNILECFDDKSSEKRAIIPFRIELVFDGDNGTNILKNSSEGKNDKRKFIRIHFRCVYKYNVNSINHDNNNKNSNSASDKKIFIQMYFSQIFNINNNNSNDISKNYLNYTIDGSSNSSRMRSDILKYIEGENDKRKWLICFPPVRIFDDRNSSGILESNCEDKNNKKKFARIHIAITPSANKKNDNNILKSKFKNKKSNNNKEWSWRIPTFRIYDDSNKTNNQNNGSSATKLILDHFMRKCCDCISFNVNTRDKITVELPSSGSFNEVNGAICISLGDKLCFSSSYINKEKKLFRTDLCELFSNNVSNNNNVDNKRKFICIYNSSNILKYNDQGNNSDKKGRIVPDWHPLAFDNRNNSYILESNKDKSDKTNAIHINDLILNEDNSTSDNILETSDEDNNYNNGSKGWIIRFPAWSLFDESSKTNNGIHSKEGWIIRIDFRLKFDNSKSSNILKNISENKEDKNKFIRTDNKNSSSKGKIEWIETRRLDDRNKTISNITYNGSMNSRSSATNFIWITVCRKCKDTGNLRNDIRENITLELNSSDISKGLDGIISIDYSDKLCSTNNNNNSKNNDEKKFRFHRFWVIKFHSSSESNSKEKNHRKYYKRIRFGTASNGSKRNSSIGNSIMRFIHIHFAKPFDNSGYSNNNVLKNSSEANNNAQKKLFSITFSEVSRCNNNDCNNISESNCVNNKDDYERKSLCFEFNDTFDNKYNRPYVQKNDDEETIVRCHFEYAPYKSIDSSSIGILEQINEDKNRKKGQFIPSWPRLAFDGNKSSIILKSNRGDECIKKKFICIQILTLLKTNNETGITILETDSEGSSNDNNTWWRRCIHIGKAHDDSKNNSQNEKNNKKKFLCIDLMRKCNDRSSFSNSTRNHIELLFSGSLNEMNSTITINLSDRLCSSSNCNKETSFIHTDFCIVFDYNNNGSSISSKSNNVKKNNDHGKRQFIYAYDTSDFGKYRNNTGKKEKVFQIWNYLESNESNNLDNNSEDKIDTKVICIRLGKVPDITGNIGSTAIKTSNDDKNSIDDNKKRFEWMPSLHLYNESSKDSNEILKNSSHDDRNSAVKFICIYFGRKYSDNSSISNEKHNNIIIKLLRNGKSDEMNSTFCINISGRLCSNSSNSDNKKGSTLSFFVRYIPITTAITSLETKMKPTTLINFREVFSCNDNNGSITSQNSNVDNDGSNKGKFVHIYFEMKFNNIKNNT